MLVEAVTHRSLSVQGHGWHVSDVRCDGMCVRFWTGEMKRWFLDAKVGTVCLQG